MSAVHDGFGAAPKGAAATILEVSETPGGPVTLAVHNQDAGSVVLAATRKSDGAVVVLEQDTQVADEDTVYNGDTSTLVFSGQSLTNTPIVPGTVVVKPLAGGTTVNGTDRDGDGRLYTSDVDEDFMGTVDYFTGALELSYPAGKAPNTGDIDADYNYGVAVGDYGKKTFGVQNLQAGGSFETLVVKAASSLGGRVRVEAFQSS